MRYNTFKKAIDLARAQQFDEFEFCHIISTPQTTTASGCIVGGYLNNWAGLFLDPEAGYFNIRLDENQNWVLFCDEQPLCKVSPDIAQMMDEKRAWEIGRHGRFAQEHREWEENRRELWMECGPGKF